ncbi:MAG TPA: hypothetical protein DCF44_03905 [Chitinophagaceae bacterium]|nr:hypothetical protein [Chitinophagaceae bacterium]
MRFIYIIFFATILISKHYGQLYSVSTPTIIGTNNWNTKIITKYNCSSNAVKIGHSYTIDYDHNIISLISCYTGPGILPVITTIKDTINIGLLPQGNYSLNYTVFISSSYSTCAPYDTITNNYSFYVGPNSIREHTYDNKYILSPNPVNNQFKILTTDNSTITKIEVCNILGDKVFEINEPLLNSNIDISFLPKGLYLLSLYTDKNKFTKKIIKE